MKTDLRISELFHSIQGEGNTMGKPSVFMRLQGCNLMCGGRGTEKDKELHDGATWRCDTIEVWLKGKKHPAQQYAIDVFNRFLDPFLNGSQLVITGGEPMLQQDQLIPFLRMLGKQTSKKIRIEVETNGTIMPVHKFATLIDQFNVSPKLVNSGMNYKARHKKEVIKYFSEIARLDHAIFKFVITNKADLEEIKKDFIKPYGINSHRIYLMPGCSTRHEFEQIAPLVVDECMKHGFQFSSRLQINLWNETTGV